MNTAYLLLTLIVLCAAIVFARKAGKTWEDCWLLPAIVSGMAVACLVALSFGAALGPTTLSLAPPTRVEHTPYRVITTAFGKEQVWTDAYTVAHVADITAVRRTVQHNAWGIEMELPAYAPSYELVFKEARP